MKLHSSLGLTLITLFFGGLSPSNADSIVLQTETFRAELGKDGVWKSLVERRTGRSLLAEPRRTVIASIRVGGKIYDAHSAKRLDDRLIVGFGEIGTRLEYQLEEAENWITFRLDRTVGPRPDRVTFLRVGVAVTEHVGSRLNGAWDERTAVVVCGVNRQALCRPLGREESTELTAAAQDAPGPRLEGTAASLLVAPTAEVRTVLAEFAEDYDLPTNKTADGVASKDTRMALGSYWFLSFAEDEVERVIECCRKTGIHQVMLNSGAWCTSPGHYLFNRDRYPDGVESLRRTVARLHEEGILVGMHCFASKVSKRDPYVTPIPDRRFLVDRTAVLAEDLSGDSAIIRTASDLSQWPGSPAAERKVWEGGVEKHQEVVIDDEIIQYESIGPEGKWNTFLGCRRGAWGTKPAAHKTDTECRHLAVDGCINGYIIDQETDLLDEVANRLAEIFNACEFDMVYFDGCEDVDRRRFDYYAANFQAVVMGKFTGRPLIHKGGGFHHNLWHSFTSSATIDQYPGTYLAYLRAGGKIDQWPTCKDHIDRTVRRVEACQEDMIPGELGWFGINPPDGQYDGLQYDEVEYLMCKSLAYDAPISLQTSFARMEQHPLTDDILALIKRYEALRHEQYGRPHMTLDGLSRTDLRRLKSQGRDFLIETNSIGSPTIVEMEPLTLPEPADDVRAFLGHSGEGPAQHSLLTLWHARGREGELVLDSSLLPESIVIFDELRDESSSTLDVDGLLRPVLLVDRRYRKITFHGASVEQVRAALENSEFRIRPPRRVWIQAEEFSECNGAMAKGSATGIDDPGAVGDFVVCTGRIDRAAENLPYCEYRVQIPKAGLWTLWARVRYPRGGDMSFGFVPEADEVTLDGNQVLGNCGANDAGWHWTGRGGGVTTVPPGSPIRLKLEKGEFAFRIYPREGHGTMETNPRLDLICLCEAPGDLPTETEVQQHLTD